MTNTDSAFSGIEAEGDYPRQSDHTGYWFREKARDRAAEELENTFDEANTESLPYEDAQFDAVIGLVGALFAPRPYLVAAKLVCSGRRTGCLGLKRLCHVGV